MQGTTELKHDIDILETRDQAKQVGLGFNPDKCVIKRKEIRYFGNVVGTTDVKPGHTKIKAIDMIDCDPGMVSTSGVVGV